MSPILNVLMFILSCGVLFLCGAIFIKSISKISHFLRLGEFVVSFIIVGMATSLPELFIGITSAMSKQPSLALGNVIGANIANLTLILGIPVILSRGINIPQKTIRKDSIYMFFIALLPLILMYVGKSLSRIDGIILVIFFFIYCYVLIKQRRAFHERSKEYMSRKTITTYMLLFPLTLLGLYYAAESTVKYASLISLDIGLPQIFIGLFIISLGTTLPELVVGLSAVAGKKSDILLGNIMGSIIANSTLVLGITAIIMPITANLLIFFTSIAFMIIAAFLFMTFVESGNRLYWKEGVAMILIYVFFIMIEFYINQVI